MLNSHNEYRNAYAPNNVYGRALELLKRNSGRTNARSRIHVDIGCGRAAIAEKVRDELGLEYIGFDGNEDSVNDLKQRGFEAYLLNLEGIDATRVALTAALDGRSVASITMLDTLEHLPDGDAVLAAIREVAQKDNSLLVFSVPNVAHRDVGFKLAFGMWSYTDAGLLDHTHVRLFDRKTFEKTLRKAGLHVIDNFDVHQNHSDQYFPDTHPVLAGGTLLRSYLKKLRNNVDLDADVNQFVFACLPGGAVAEQPFINVRESPRPFLSIVTRTQGKRLHCLVEYFTSLAGQSCDDFEVVIVGHHLSIEKQIGVEGVIEDNPEWLRTRTRLVLDDRGNRAHPLNVGFAAANGRYIAILDDDDLPLGHWVEAFKALEQENEGKLLRCVSLKQNIVDVNVLGRKGIRSVAHPEACYPSTYDHLDHLRQNYSPNNTLAFPRGVFHFLNLKFDEALSTTEDWDYIVRVANVVGVASSEAVTGIYHWWTTAHSSRTEHADNEWSVNYSLILQKMDRDPVLLPPGSTAKIRALLSERDGDRRHIEMLREQIRGLESSESYLGGHVGDPETYAPRFGLVESGYRRVLDEELARRLKMERVVGLLESRSWRISAPLRFVKRIVSRGRSVSISACSRMTIAELDQVIAAIEASASWRLTAPLRRH